MSDVASQAILRTLSFHEAWSYAPTLPELFGTLDTEGASVSAEDVLGTLERFTREGTTQYMKGRYGFPHSVSRIVTALEARGVYQPRKLRRARRVASWLMRLGGVRFVALANTTALGSARDLSDLDFFIVVRKGSIWTTRLIAASAAKLFGVQPRGDEVRDAVCFSYFVADDALDLSSHQLQPDDPYFRYWFLSLLPLVDDGVGEKLWEANHTTRARFPSAHPWSVSSALARSAPWIRVPVFSVFESLARMIQEPRLPRAVQELMNKDSRVIVTDSVLKFHVEDGREAFREAYTRRMTELGFSL